MKQLRALLVLVVVVSACSGNNLSRQKAAELISRQLGLPAAQTIVIGTYIKKSWSDPSWLPAVCLVTGERYSDVQGRLAEWESRGLITIAESRQHQGECNYLWATTSLTDEGKKYLVKESGGALEVRVYDLGFGEVTGIQINEQFKAAEADYTLRVINITPFAGNVSTEPRGGKATFSLFDDGWRISR